MTVIGMIPARWASRRFAGKVLVDIKGKPMIQHVWERAQRSRVLQDVYIVCDHEKVLTAAQGFGAKAIMTSTDHRCGTDRIAEAAQDIKADSIINIQGDEPLINPAVIDALAQQLEKDPACSVTTPICRLKALADLDNPAVVKVVIDHNRHALYFSRSAIPFNRDQQDFGQMTYYKHLGIYAYRREFLLRWHQLPSSYLEQAEKLEQLRILEAGETIVTVETPHDTIGVDTAQDLDRVLAILDEKTS